MLMESESKWMYHRKRMAQSGPPPAKKNKSNSPNFSKVLWDTEGLQATLKNWPSNVTINWTAVGKQHGISGANARQVVKEFAESQNMQITTPLQRGMQPGIDIPIPANPPVRSIEAEIQHNFFWSL